MRRNFVSISVIARACEGARYCKRAMLLAGAVAVAGMASPAAMAREPSTRLVECGEQNCLVISGHRDDTSAAVSINGQAVPVEGGHGWQVSLPVETVRAWSGSYARTIQISLLASDMSEASVISVDLPIGLLGNVTDLASLEIHAH